MATSEELDVKEITFLFTDLKGSTAFYDRIVDRNAHHRVRQHLDTLGKVIADHSGSIVKTIGDAITTTLADPVDAAGAAVEKRREIEAFNAAVPEAVVLKIGIPDRDRSPKLKNIIFCSQAIFVSSRYNRYL